MPVAPRSLRAIPLARGLVRLSGSLSPLFKREGVARGRERIFLIVAILAPLALAFAPNWLGLTAGFVTTFALLGWLLRGRTLYLHGAEHRAIAALEQRRLRETWHGAALRHALLAALWHELRRAVDARRDLRRAFLASAAHRFHARRRVRARARHSRWSCGSWCRACRASRASSFCPASGLQRLTTREPRLDETRIALTALAAVLRRELAHG